MRVEAAHITVHTPDEVDRILSDALDLTSTAELGDVTADAYFTEASRLLSARASAVQASPDSFTSLPQLGRNAGGSF